jgi:alanyl-tRNA synthetase
MMTSAQIRQSFLDFFKSKQHTIVPSSSLMPDSPNLLFTNAGMNQFVPIFLGQTKCPYIPGRAADTQKCIRAGGKHNELDDVGLDTYHHTFFEMLGNWSFGDYFKKEAIDWAWELVVEKWKFPPQRLYATVFCPHMNTERWENELHAAVEIAKKGGHLMTDDTSDIAQRIQKADEESATRWAINFLKAGLDPFKHIVPGNRKDNFWMMGDTGPCGPCSELHVDLTPNGDTRGSLVNKGDARCIEIWNLVFIQFNANPDGTFSPLPAKHVDTGVGFERVTSIIQGTKNFTDFANAKISNYETDIFRPIFDELEKLSGQKYTSTLPSEGRTVQGNELIAFARNSQLHVDIAFRVIADHIRTLSFAIADGIQPGNTDRNYVLRRILRRAVRYGRTLSFHEPFFYKLVDVLADTMGDVFPEIRARKKQVQETIRTEEEAFNRTLDKGLELFELALSTRKLFKSKLGEFSEIIERLEAQLNLLPDNYASAKNRLVEMVNDVEKLSDLTDPISTNNPVKAASSVSNFATIIYPYVISNELQEKSYGNFVHGYSKFLEPAKKGIAEAKLWKNDELGGQEAFVLYDTYGFPLDLTELMARERGLTVEKEGFQKLMEEQRARARAAQKKEVISLSQIETTAPTKFVGFEKLESPARVLEVVSVKDKTAVVLDKSPFYAEMGGQVGDTGEILFNSVAADVSRLTSSVRADSRLLLRVTNTQKSGNTWLHFVNGENLPAIGDEVVLRVEAPRRNAIQRHHTVTHLLHWALHEVASREASQKGSFVGPDKLTFDFNSAPLTSVQVADIEKLVNERILENAGVSWTEVAHAAVKNRKDVMQFFGDKYGDMVRVVQIGGHAEKLDGYSMELCGGTHTLATGEIGLFRIIGESAIAAGVRRIEAVAGLEAYRKANEEVHLIKTLAGKVNSPVHELENKIESLLAHQKELEKQFKSAQQREASNVASNLLEQVKMVNGIPAIIHNVGGVDGDFLQAVADSLKGRFKGVIVLGGAANGAVALVAAVSPDFTEKIQAGKIIQQIAPIVGGKGGGKPDNARGGGKDAGKLDEALAKAENLIQN